MNEAQRLYAEAVEALNRRQWEAAHAMGLRLVGMVPGHGGVHFVAGVAALQLQRLPEGVRHLQRAVHLSPARADYAAQFARALAMARLTREALVAADAAAAMAPDDAATLDTLGVVYTQANEHAKAIALAKPLFEFPNNLLGLESIEGQDQHHPLLLAIVAYPELLKVQFIEKFLNIVLTISRQKYPQFA